MENTIESFIDQRRGELLAFTSKLIATPSPNLPGDERAVVSVIQAELDRLGMLGAEIVAKYPHRPNVVLRLKGSQPGPTVLLGGHSDTKPVGDQTCWQTDPFEPVVRDGKMYGLGTTDMKSAVAAMIFATAALQHGDVELAGDVLLVINADEERSMECGSEYLSVDYGIQADVALLGEPSGIDGPEFEFLHIVSRGLSCFKIRVRGTQMHSSLTDRMPAVSANVQIARVLNWMTDHLELKFQSHPLCEAPTINLGVKIEGGVGYGVCPGVAEFESDIRTLPGMTREQLEADIVRCLDQLRHVDPSLDLAVEFEESALGWFPPTEVPSDHPFIKSLLDAADRVLGWRPKLSAFPGGTDAKNYQTLAGIPTIPSFGPGWLPLAHGPNECVGTEAIVQAAKMYGLAVQAYLAPQ